jgi:predicted AAA+ superfamily ATPase
MNPEKKVWLFFDEVQNIDGWEHFVNSLSQDFVNSYEIFLSGSNSKMLSGELATLLLRALCKF